MKISLKLSIAFSVIVITLLIFLGMIVLYLTSLHNEYEFNNRLKERVLITENVFLEKESFTTEEFEKITNDFLQKLEGETEEVILITKDTEVTFQYDYPITIKKNILKYPEYTFSFEGKQGASRKFLVNNQEYLVVVTAIDVVADENENYLRKVVLGLIGLSIPIIFLTGYFISKQLLSPISRKIDKANTISASNLHMRLTVQTADDEIGKLAIAFNKLLDRLENSFEAQKAFISNASHEMKNPLTAIIGEAEVTLSKVRKEEDYVEALNKILNEAEGLNSTVNNLLQLSKVSVEEDSNVNFKQFNVYDFLKDIIDNYIMSNPSNNVSLTDFEDDPIPILISANRELLKTAITNIIDNACKFSKNKPVFMTLTGSDQYANIEIIDQGIGIDSSEFLEIQKPFYRSSNAIRIKGSGIGLALTSKIILMHKGVLEFSSELNRGTTVSVTLPL